MKYKLITVPFDVEKAKQITNNEIEGKIVTRDGRNARIICWDRNNETYPIVVLVPDEEDGIEDSLFFTENGTYYEEGETKDDLFLQIPEYLTFKDGDVLKGDKLIFILNANGDYKTSIYAGIFLPSGNITYGGAASMDSIEQFTLAIESEKQKLIKALQESNNPRAKDCLKKLGVEVKPKCELKPFDKVLCRENVNAKWEVDIFRHIIENDNSVYIYSCMCDTWKYCIPYEGNEHLLGTNKNAEE